MLSPDLLQSVSHSPGIYIMRGKTSVLYVGKAKDLHKRLSSYVRFSGADHNKTAVMLSKVVKVDTIITRTEKEALILEASLIKKHKPKYNVILRDDKNYPLIKLTIQEEWPRLMMTRRKKRWRSLLRTILLFIGNVEKSSSDSFDFPPPTLQVTAC